MQLPQSFRGMLKMAPPRRKGNDLTQKKGSLKIKINNWYQFLQQK